MFRIAVCDDSPVMTGQLKDALLSEINIPSRVDVYEDGQQLVSAHKKYDLIFLDVDMPELGGIETARAIRKYDKRVMIVYVTVYQDYARAALGVHAFSYLIKPVTDAQVSEILKEAYGYYLALQIPRQVTFETLEGSVVLDVRQIYYFEYTERKIRLVTDAGVFWLKGRLTDIYIKMDDEGFEMPHKSYVVNLLYVRLISGFDIYMTNGDKVMLSQKKASAFRRTLFAYVEKEMR